MAASHSQMKPALFLCLSLALHAEPALLTYDAGGRLLHQARAVVRPGGIAYVARDALAGAASASLLDDNGQLHPLLWITGEDADSGVLEIYIGAQAPKGPDAASALGKSVRTATHDATVRYTREAGGYGFISRLDCGASKDNANSPLYDEHGLLAGWHAVKTIDGQPLAFAIPLARLESVNRTIRVSLRDWNNSLDPSRGEDYQRGLGHIWAEDFDGAAFYLRKTVESSPTFARAWYHLAFAEGKLGHGKAKTAGYRKAVELDPTFAPARYYLGFSLLMNGDTDGAQEQCRKLAQLDPAWATRLQFFLSAAHVDTLEKGKPPAHQH